MDKISIHTPAKGVTEAVFLGQRIFGNFNPHSREGSDQCQTPLRPACFYFNPHSREGSDSLAEIQPLSERISIHTPAKGVTDPEGYQIYGLGISIHTPAKGVTDPEGYQIYGLGISIHTPAKGVTTVLLLKWKRS